MESVGLTTTLVSGGNTVVGHSYTAAYRYQLVIGNIGGWAIPYPLTIPQAVVGLAAVLATMVTATWWYPLTGVAGAVMAVALPVIGVRLIARIRPEGRSVSHWIHGWVLAQHHALGHGVPLTLGPAARARITQHQPGYTGAGVPSHPATTSQPMPAPTARPTDRPSLDDSHETGPVEPTANTTGITPIASDPHGHQNRRRMVARPPDRQRTSVLSVRAHITQWFKARKSLGRSHAMPAPDRAVNRHLPGWLAAWFARSADPSPPRVPVFDPWAPEPAQSGGLR